jgi:hypothetical protein
MLAAWPIRMLCGGAGNGLTRPAITACASGEESGLLAAVSAVFPESDVSRAVALRLATVACDSHGAPAVAALRTLAELVDRRADRPPPTGLVTVDTAAQLVAEQTMAMAADLVGALLPLKSGGDVRYRDTLLTWCRDRMRAATSDEPLPDMPTAPIEPETVFPGRDQPSPQWRTSVVDAEIITDEKDDADDDEDDPPDLVELRAEVARLRTAVGVS